MSMSSNSINVTQINLPIHHTDKNLSYSILNNISYLESNAIANTTRNSYSKAWSIIDEYAKTHNINIYHYNNYDQLLTDLLNQLYAYCHSRNQSGLALATHIVSAFCHYMPQYKHTIPKTRRALKGYNKLKPSESHPAMSWHVTLVSAMLAASYYRHDISVAMLLQFDCYLRVNELLNLKISDILIPDDNRFIQSSNDIISTPFRRPPTIIVTLLNTKTGQYQSVQVNEFKIECIVLDWIERRKQQQQTTLFDFDQKHYNKTIQYITHQLGFTNTHYTSHSLRHGGATHDLQRYGTNATTAIQQRGRWKTNDSVQIYTQGLGKAAHSQPASDMVLQDYALYANNYHVVLGQLIRSRSSVHLQCTLGGG